MKNLNSDVNCPSCGSGSRLIFSKELGDEINIKILQCTLCDLVFDCSNIDDSKLFKFIAKDYYKSKDVGFEINKRFIRHFTNRALSHIRLINAFFPTDFKGNVLDIGCGAGIFLDSMRSIGWNSFGIEPSEDHYLYGKKLNLDIQNCLFNAYQASNKFDLIYLSHVFDDLPNISETFKNITDLLNQNGKVFVEVPNYNRYKNFSLVKDGDLIENQYYFTPESIRSVFENNGYKVLYLQTHESIYLNDIFQYIASPYELIKRYIIPDSKKEQIRLVAIKK